MSPRTPLKSIAPGTTAKGHTRPTDRPLLAIVLINLAVFVFTTMDGIIKFISADFPTGEIVFCRNLFAFLPVIGFALARRQRLVLRTTQPWGHVWRGLSGVGAMYCYFLSYRLLPLSEAIALGLAGPIFITVLSVPLLRERVGWRRWSAVLVGFAGVLIMTRPGAGIFNIAALVPLLAAVFYALAMVSIRQLSASEQPITIVFYFTLFATVAALASLPLGFLDPAYRWHWPADLSSLATLALIGLMGGCGQILLTLAFRLGSVSLVAPFDYMALVYAFLIGYFAFAEMPDAYLIAGGATVVLSGVYIIHRETIVARQQHRAQPAPPLPTAE